MSRFLLLSFMKGLDNVQMCVYVLPNMQTIIVTAKEMRDRARKVGLSDKELCEIAGIANSTFTRWKSGRTRPSMDRYCRIIEALEQAEAIARYTEGQRTGSGTSG